jgi:hypothetical protein
MSAPFSLGAVPDRHREHADEATERRFNPPRLECGEDDFGIGMTDEAAALLLQLMTKLTVVVDFAIEDHREPPAVRLHGLVAVGAQVDDRKPPESERDAVLLIEPEAFVVRPAVAQRRTHAGRTLRDVAFLDISCENARQTAHERLCFSK